MLEEAKQQGDVLFVMINSDDSIKAKKGDSRPIIEQEYRAAMLAGLVCVDYVIIVDSDYDSEPHGTFLPTVKPDVHVNAGDYGDPEKWVEWPMMQEIGAQAHYVAIRPGFSTSDIVKKIKES